MSSMPTNSKTWAFDTNNEVNTGDPYLDLQELVWQFVVALKAFGCTITRCSYWNGSSYTATDGDQWLAKSNLEWRTATSNGARAWAVLKFPTTPFGNFSILLDCARYNANYSSLGFRVSWTGYNLDGTTSTLPTVVSGTEYGVHTWTTWVVGDHLTNFAGHSTAKKIWNVATSTDGQCFRYWVMAGGNCSCYISINKLKNPVPGLTDSGKKDDIATIIKMADATGTPEVVTYANFYTSATAQCMGNILASGNAALELSGECRMGATSPATSSLAANPNPQDDSKWPMLPVGVWSSVNTAYAYGRMGEVYDLWWVSPNLVNGSTFPGDGSKTHIKLGQAFVVPWDGTAPLLS